MEKFKRFMKVVLCTLLVASLFYFDNDNASAEENYIVIEKGDTLYSISKQFNTPIQVLKAYNNLKNNTIYIGQKLFIPDSNQFRPLYIVSAGSFFIKKNAEKQVSFLKKKGIRAVIVPKVINDKIYYRVQAGVFSSKQNAEKQRRILQDIGIKDAYFLTEMPLHINGVTSGSPFNQLVEQFGTPYMTESISNIESFYYANEGAGVRAKFNMKNGSLDQLQVYPEYLNDDSIPNNKAKILALYGNPNEVKKVSCYESATCELFVYRFNGNKLIVQFDRDKSAVQYLDLRVLR